MADAITEIQAKFTADIADLQAGLSNVQSQLQNFEGQSRKSGASASTMGKQTRQSMETIQRGLSAITPVLSRSGQQFVGLGMHAINTFAGIAEGATNLKATLQTALVGAVAAGGFALGQYLGELAAGTAEIERMAKRLKNLANTQKEFNTAAAALDTYTKKTREAAIRARFFGEQEEYLNTVISQGRTAIVTVSTELETLRERYKEIARERERVRNSPEFNALSWKKIQDLDQLLIQNQAQTKGLTQEWNDLWKAIQEATEKLTLWKAAQKQDKLSRLSPEHRENVRNVLGQADQPDFGGNVAAKIEQNKTALQDFFVEATITMGDMANLAGTVSQSMSSSFAQAFTQMALYGGNFGDVMVSVFQAVAQAAIQWVAEMVMKMITMYIASIIYGNIQAYSNIPWIGLAIGVAAAGAALGAAAAMTRSKGGATFAEGGLVMGPTFGLIGEAGPEIIAPRSQFESLMTPHGGQSTVVFEVDGRELARGIVPWIPGALRLKGIRAS